MDNEKFLKQLEEAKKDSEWVEKVTKARTKEELVQLYEEKIVELPEDIKNKLFQKEEKVKKLDDEELSNVAGGYSEDCPEEYEVYTCLFGSCPHLRLWFNVKDFQFYVYCDQNYFEDTVLI